MILSPPGQRLLLASPDFLLRRTVAALSRQLLALAVEEASGLARASALLETGEVDLLVLDLVPADGACALLRHLRSGLCAAPQALPVVALADACNAALAAELRELGVRRLLLKPFTVKAVLGSIEAVVTQPDPRPPPVDASAVAGQRS